MQLLYTILVILLSLPATTASNHRGAEIKAWEVSRLSIFFPSGRPGSSPWCIVNATITDPNDCSSQGSRSTPAISRAICAAKWEYNTSPYNQIYACTNSDVSDDGIWRFEMLEAEPGKAENYQSVITDFVLRFTRHVPAPSTDNEERRANMTAALVGSARFTVGPEENMEGICGASGICSFGLRQERTPFHINQTRVE